VVSTDVGDVRSIVAGIDGVEICDQDAPAIAGGLSRVFERTERGWSFDGRSAMGRFDQTATAEAILEVYRTVLSKRTWVNARTRLS
jgi:hypothetical protein